MRMTILSTKLSNITMIRIHRNYLCLTFKSSIKKIKNTKTVTIALHVYNNLQYKITLSSGLLGYCQRSATIHPTQERAYRVKTVS